MKQDLAIKKASQSECEHKVSAIGFNHKGEVIGTQMNTMRFNKLGGGNHAETMLMKRYGKQLKTIVVCRVNNSGWLLKIDPCSACQKLANKLGIKLLTLERGKNEMDFKI